MTTEQIELSWRVGGPQGSGVDTAARLYGWACALGGLHVFGRREYYSNIMGRHSYYDIRAATFPLHCHRDTVDLLVTFEPETFVRHVLAIVEGGAVVHSADDKEVPLDRITFLDARYQNDLTKYLAERDLPASTEGLLTDARNRGINTFAIPYDDLSSALAEKMDVPKSLADRTLNTMAVAVSTAMGGYDRRHMYSALQRTFAGKEKVVELNKEAVNLVYDYVRANIDLSRFKFRLAEVERDDERLFVGGSQVVAMGKMAGGLGFQTYYPISPATDESVYLEGHANFGTTIGEEASVVVVQTEDELSAITMACGAALTGARSSTATSGPGFSLMAEAVGWAGTNEIPVVLTLWQRGGPSTGMPTRTEQGDLQFAINAGHGDFPKIVFASGDLEEAFYDAAESFNYADRYQLPVIHLVDKAIGSTTCVISAFDPTRVKIDRGVMFTPGSSNGVNPVNSEGLYERFAPTDTGITPRAVLGQPGGAHWTTGGEHTPRGRVTEDPVVREQQMEKRMGKLNVALQEIPLEDKLRVYGADKPDITLLSWGSTKGAILETIDAMAEENIAVRAVHIRLLWPFPVAEVVEAIRESTSGGAPLVAVELNYSGQLVKLLREQTGLTVDHLIVKYNGRPISGRELRTALRTIHSDGAADRIVVRNPLE